MDILSCSQSTLSFHLHWGTWTLFGTWRVSTGGGSGAHVWPSWADASAPPSATGVMRILPSWWQGRKPGSEISSLMTTMNLCVILQQKLSLLLTDKNSDNLCLKRNKYGTPLNKILLHARFYQIWKYFKSIHRSSWLANLISWPIKFSRSITHGPSCFLPKYNETDTRQVFYHNQETNKTCSPERAPMVFINCTSQRQTRGDNWPVTRSGGSISLLGLGAAGTASPTPTGKPCAWAELDVLIHVLLRKTGLINIQ